MRAMSIDRRTFLIAAAASAATASPARAAPLSTFGVDAAQFGVRPGAPDDQSAKLQRALDHCAQTRAPLMLAPGVYRAGDLKLAPGVQVFGVRGATRLSFTRGASLISAEGADNVTLSGIGFEGNGIKLPPNRGLVHLTSTRGLRLTDCTVGNAGGNGIAITNSDSGSISGNSITGSADNGLYCVDNTGFIITANIIRNAGNGGIRVWQSTKRHDGSIVADNTVEDIAARAGGTGQNGNAVNVFRAANVTVRNNTIRRCAFSAVRGNEASNMQVIGNNCAVMKETAMYAEFDYEGALFAQNVIETAENGIAVTNFNNGGRLAVVHGNLLRNVGVRRPDNPPEWTGVGIGVEAETACTGNVIEDAPGYGIRAGWGPYLRNVTVSGNVVRNAGIGIAVSVVRGAGDAAITGNVISGAKRGGFVGMEWAKAVTGDLIKDGAGAYPQLKIADNQAR
jgi:uncharacterized secreted repeat protein (TIGR03808 family)